MAVLLNITPDHLDRHGGMDGYIAAKARIFEAQRAAQTAVIGVDDEPSRALHGRFLGARQQTVIPISGEGPVAGGVYAHDGWLQDDRAGTTERVLRLAEASNLLGKHNWQNAAAAFAACSALGLATPKIVAGIKSYPGLAHRQELVATIGDVRYINDSKATNADAAAKALACYQPIYWIAGGRAKEGGLAGLEPFYPRIAHAFLIGEAGSDFAAALEGRVACTKCGTIARRARRRPSPGAGRAQAGRGRAAVAGLRLVRPVREFRGARRSLPQAGGGALRRADAGQWRHRPAEDAMTLTFARTDTSIVGRWWWTVDRWMLAALGMLVFCGIILVMAASPAVAERIGLDRFYLVRHQLVLLPVALFARARRLAAQPAQTCGAWR